MNDRTWNSVTHAFAAAKANNDSDVKKLRDLTAKEVVEFAKRIEARPAWNEIELPCLRHLLYQKFGIVRLPENSDVNRNIALLLETGNETIIYDNKDCETFYGVCQCPKHDDSIQMNMIGHMLEAVRMTIVNNMGDANTLERRTCECGEPGIGRIVFDKKEFEVGHGVFCAAHRDITEQVAIQESTDGKISVHFWSHNADKPRRHDGVSYKTPAVIPLPATTTTSIPSSFSSGRSYETIIIGGKHGGKSPVSQGAN